LEEPQLQGRLILMELEWDVIRLRSSPMFDRQSQDLLGTTEKEVAVSPGMKFR
jgi:hypothetical protein